MHFIHYEGMWGNSLKRPKILKTADIAKLPALLNYILLLILVPVIIQWGSHASWKEYSTSAVLSSSLLNLRPVDGSYPTAKLPSLSAPVPLQQ